MNSQYRPLLASDIIDGVFVPDAGDGPVVVSTTGLVFRECPDTCGKYYRGIFNGAKIGPEIPESPNGQAALRGQEYGIPGRPAINLHANAGITFDLSKVREAFPGVQVERFRALCGISETLNSFHVGLIEVNCYVLVDGQIAFSSLRMRGDSEAVDIDIPLNYEDRFLTLIATDTDGKGVGFHWSLFAQPVLDLAVEGIGFSFGGRTDKTLGGLIGLTEVAGFTGYEQANWNTEWSSVGNVTPVNQTVSNLLDSRGATTGVSLTYHADGAFGYTTPDSPDGRLFGGYLDGKNTSDTTAEFSNIPYPTYDVVIYACTGTGTYIRITEVTVVNPSDNSIIAGPYYFR